MEATNLLPGAWDFLVRCPNTGGGVLGFLFDATTMLHRTKTPPEEMRVLLRTATRDCRMCLTGKSTTQLQMPAGERSSHPPDLKDVYDELCD
jgi:hypothetical protein